jgi:hypothetical protein
LAALSVGNTQTEVFLLYNIVHPKSTTISSAENSMNFPEEDLIIVALF